MQPVVRHSIAYQSIELQDHLEDGWLQAGFNSFAYRLAHFEVTRAVLVSVLAGIFYIV